MMRVSAARAMTVVAALVALAVLALNWVPQDHHAHAQGTTVIFSVDTTADTVDSYPGDGQCADADGHCSLRAAIMEANALMLGGRRTLVIQLPPRTFPLTIPPDGESDVFVDFVDSKGDLDIVPANDSFITLKGAGMDQTVITAQNLTRVLEIGWPQHDYLLRGTAEIQDLTVTGGNVQSVGGGIRAGGPNWLILTRVALRDNRAGAGGGLWAIGKVTIVRDSEFTGNEVRGGSGGGMYGAPVPQGSLAITNSLFSGNRALTYCSGSVWGDPPRCSGWGGGIGGGLVIAGDTGAGLYVSNVTIDNNVGAYGAGLRFLAAELRTLRSTETELRWRHTRTRGTFRGTTQVSCLEAGEST
jgi:CSLREA domain-containing protein